MPKVIQESNVKNVGNMNPSGNGINGNVCRIEKGPSIQSYRIRKLIPRECGRLMGVSERDIDRMEEVNSDSQLYKQYGNSIVVDVMCAMFRNLNIKGVDTWEEYLERGKYEILCSKKRKRTRYL